MMNKFLTNIQLFTFCEIVATSLLNIFMRELFAMIVVLLKRGSIVEWLVQQQQETRVKPSFLGRWL